MAKDRTTSARDFQLADGDQSSPPRLSDWLIKDLRGARPSQAPAAPPPLDGSVAAALPTAPPGESPTAAVVAGSAAAPFVEGPGAPAAETAADDGAGETDELGADAGVDDDQRESLELAESLSYARADELAADTVPESIPPRSGGDAGAVYADPADWLDDDDDTETTSFFTATAARDELLDDSGAALDAGVGTSLSPQVLTEEERDDEAAFLLPGTAGGAGHFRAIAAVGVALLLVFMVVHRLRAPARATATASRPVAAAALANGTPVPNTALVDSPAPEEDALGEARGARSGLADGLGRSRGSSPEPTSDPVVPGGPSVARFPDLPREILKQLEQAFESEESQRGKSTTDSVERYSH
jgi:hypothetical protein